MGEGWRTKKGTSVSLGVGASESIIEFTTCFHELSEYESTNYFTSISQLKKRAQIPCWSKKVFFPQFLAFEKI